MIKKSYSKSTTAKGIEVGAVLAEGWYEGIQILVRKGSCSFCAYIGIPEDHPLAGKNYDDEPVCGLQCHGGLTFSREGGGDWPAGYWWYGWDYGHLGDKIHYPSGIELPNREPEHDWTLGEVVEQAQEVAGRFLELEHEPKL